MTAPNQQLTTDNDECQHLCSTFMKNKQGEEMEVCANCGMVAIEQEDGTWIEV